MKSGEIDMAYRQLAATDFKDFQTDPTVKVWQGPGASYSTSASKRRYHRSTIPE